jgi:hypothetical protein
LLAVTETDAILQGALKSLGLTTSEVVADKTWVLFLPKAYYLVDEVVAPVCGITGGIHGGGGDGSGVTTTVTVIDPMTC